MTLGAGFGVLLGAAALRTVGLAVRFGRAVMRGGAVFVGCRGVRLRRAVVAFGMMLGGLAMMLGCGFVMSGGLVM